MNAPASASTRLGLLLTATLVCTAPPAIAGSGEPVADYLVTVRGEPGPESVHTSGELVTRHGGTVRFVYHQVLAGYAATMTTSQARQVAADPEVTAVTLDTGLQPAGRRTTRSGQPATSRTWHLDRINQRLPRLDNNTTIGRTGKGVTIYVVDEGIRLTHEELAGRASPGIVTAGDPQTSWCSSHGTNVASMAAGRTLGVAKEAEIVSVRGVKCGGLTPVWETVAAIDWITGNAVRPAVVNTSFKITGATTSMVQDAISRSVANGLTYVAAAGNDDEDACGQVPMRIPEVITVGSVETIGADANGARPTDSVTKWSNWGECVDILAPGSDLTVASATGDNAVVHGEWGTSLSAPMVAGAAALYLEEHPDAPPAEVGNALIHESTKDVTRGSTPRTPNRLLHTAPGK